MGMTMGKSNTNFFDSLPSQALHVVMLGLDSAGKTTALYRLKFDQYLNTVPTIGFNCEKVQGSIGKAKGVQFLVWDVGGQEKLRPLWRSYTRCTDGILFVVDSVDIERMEEAKIELMRTAKCPDNQGVPVLVLANKQDLPGACDPKQLETYLGLQELQYQLKCTTLSSSASDDSSKTLQDQQSIGDTTSRKLGSISPCNSLQYKGWYVQAACAITGEGLQEGLEVLYEMIIKRRKLNKACRKKR